MTMTNKQALREAAAKAVLEEGLTWWSEEQLAHEDGVVLHQADAQFVAAADPQTVLALLDELEAAGVRWSAQDDHINQQACWIESLEKKNGEIGKALVAAQKRIAELENDELRQRLANAEHGQYLTHVVDDDYGEFSDRMNFSLPVGTKLYSAPPAPVVPDEKRDDDGEVTSEFDLGWNACRAAMLQGAEPVTTDYKLPDGWALVPIKPTQEMIEASWHAMVAAAPDFNGEVA